MADFDCAKAMADRPAIIREIKQAETDTTAPMFLVGKTWFPAPRKGAALARLPMLNRRLREIDEKCREE